MMVAYLPARVGHAQYKNLSFGIDGGYDVINRPTILDGPDSVITDAKNFPLRLSDGGRLGLETSLKMHSDHWWLTFRLNVHLMGIGTRGDQPGSYGLQYDTKAKAGIGTVLGLEPLVGLRRYFLTDRVRPYLQGGLAYMRLITFSDAQSCLVGDGSTPFCDSTGSDLTSYLTHQNLLSLQLQPGIEFILVRDLALSISCSYSHWFLFNAKDNDVFTPAIGLTIYG